MKIDLTIGQLCDFYEVECCWDPEISVTLWRDDDWTWHASSWDLDLLDEEWAPVSNRQAVALEKHVFLQERNR